MTTQDIRSNAESTNMIARGRVLLLTGMSGAGRSMALMALEDTGYEAVDNLPLFLVPALIQNAVADAPTIAVGADLRTRGLSSKSMLATLDEVVRQTARELRVIFIDRDDEQLERRYTETRSASSTRRRAARHGRNAAGTPSGLRRA